MDLADVLRLTFVAGVLVLGVLTYAALALLEWGRARWTSRQAAQPGATVPADRATASGLARHLGARHAR
jgi:hypothetical protein